MSGIVHLYMNLVFIFHEISTPDVFWRFWDQWLSSFPHLFTFKEIVPRVSRYSPSNENPFTFDVLALQKVLAWDWIF